MAATKILVIGSSSLVGSHFVERFCSEYELSGAGRRNIFADEVLSRFQKMDLSDEKTVRQVIESSDAEFVINYAADTNLDACERESGSTSGSVYETNAGSLAWLADSCRRKGKRLIQLSTDFVFDGTAGPYREEDTPGPVRTKLSWYGYTKYMAERILHQADSEGYCIVRISYPYRARFAHKTDFARSIIDLYRNRKLYPVFADQQMSPTLIDDVSEATNTLIRNNAKGIYHIACASPTTPYEFATKLLSACFPEDSPVLQKGSIVEMNSKSGRAPRPVQGGLKVKKIRALGFEPNPYEQGIEKLVAQLKTD